MEMLGAVGRGTPEDPGSWRFPLRVRPRTDATMALHKFIYKLQMGVVVRFDRKSKQRNGC